MMEYSQTEQEVNREINRDIPYFAHEEMLARSERTIKRLIVTLIIAVILLFGSNMAWLHYISDCDIQTYEYTQDGEGVNLVGDGNGVTYNEPKSQSPSDSEEKS